MIERNELARRIAEAAVLRGTFTLRSGRTSSYYIDKYLFLCRPEIVRELGSLVSSRLPEGVDRLAGAELGGIPLVTAASMASGLPCVFVRNSRKDYGTAKQIEGKLERGDRVVIVEDVATTGGQALDAARVLAESGAKVVGIIATVDRQEGAREAIEREGIAFEALFTKADLGIDAPAG
jgi:orotate phosphoribosyltransferase